MESPGDVLFPIDRDVLAASHTVIRRIGVYDDVVTDLGVWIETSTHLVGQIGIVGGDLAFGIRTRNGFSKPWFEGPAPTTNLADNPILTGTATWNGRLLGLTPSAEAVAGSAALTMNLESLDGTLAFRELEHWSTAMPEAPGTGAPWGTTELDYEVTAVGNRFVQTGGDEGTVTGVFTGSHHEGIGGTLERSDLTAAFGARR